MNIQQVQVFAPNPNIANVSPGDTVQVTAKVVEGDRERLQQFRGTVIRVRPGGAGASFTVRRLSQGVGVERTFPFHSPIVQKVEVLRRAKVRRASLYYLRGLSRKASRLKERMGVAGRAEAAEEAEEIVATESVEPPEATAPAVVPEASEPKPE